METIQELKFEYKFVTRYEILEKIAEQNLLKHKTNCSDVLNELGKDGWELVSVLQYSENSTYIFKRAKWEEKKAQEKQEDNANKIERKFKVGDWIIRSAEGFKHNTYLVTDVKDYYVCEELKGRRVTFTFNDVHKNFKLWDISDAKDDDVLVDEDIDVIGIFEGIEGMCWHSKLYYSFTTKEFYGIECGGSHLNEFAKPATKEQRNTLIKAMADAGYTFDFDKKELKKFETPLPSFDEQQGTPVIDIPFGAKDSELQEAAYIIPKGFHAEIQGDKVVIKKGKNPSWSEDDENNLTDTCVAIRKFYHGTNGAQELIDWLKSLKQRMKGE